MIVWLVPPESVTFVRVHWTSFRGPDIPMRDGNSVLVGYDTEALHGGYGRMFTLRIYDCLAPAGFTPSEAVDPMTLEPLQYPLTLEPR